jgi:hypothetical protein
MEEILLWKQPEWIAEAHRWIEQALRGAGTHLTGAIAQEYVRPWSTVMQVPTRDGLYFFKAAMPPLSSEVGVVQALAARSPGCMPEIIAAEASRGWMLLRDAGAPLRALLRAPQDLRLLDPILPRLAEVQMAWLNEEDTLIGLGLPDHRLQVLPGMFERLAADRSALMVGLENGLSEEQYRQVSAAVPRYARYCARLLAMPVGQSIHYDDMHTNNIFLRDGDGGVKRVTFLDWGDSTVSHPFCSMLIFLRAISDQMLLPEESTEIPENMPPMLTRLRDLYLEPWQKYDTREDLLDAFHLAWRVGMVARALSWHDTIAAMPAAFRPSFRHSVPAWMGEFLLALPREE